MNKKKLTITNNLWWLDYSMLNLSNITFKYYYFNNIFFIKLLNFYYFFLVNRYNLNSMLFYNLDASIVKGKDNNYFIALQTFFFDLQILIQVNFNKYLTSLSKVYSGNTWIERELKEFNEVYFINLNDNRKLLSNYNYNNSLQYNQFNNIVNDIKI